MKTVFYKHIELDSELEEIKMIFDENNIVYEISSSGAILDETIVGNGLFSKYTLKILPEDFTKANELISINASKKDINIEDFAYLKELTDDELMDILQNPQEWTSETEVVAKKLLSNRGVEVSDEKIARLRNEKNSELRKGKSVSILEQLLYFLSIAFGFYFSVFFFIAGIAMGFYYYRGKATDNNGEKYFVYDERARTIGKFILYGGILCLCLQIFIVFSQLS